MSEMVSLAEQVTRVATLLGRAVLRWKREKEQSSEISEIVSNCLPERLEFSPVSSLSVTGQNDEATGNGETGSESEMNSTNHVRGTYRFQITDHAAMRAEVPGRIDRLRLLMFHHTWPALMETSVSWANEELVRHTTRITSLGIFCMDSEEMFYLNENGNQFTVAMSQRLAPTFWLKRVFPAGHGEVNAECDGATYHLPWVGGVICQHTEITDRGVELKQTSPWFSGSVLLVRK